MKTSINKTYKLVAFDMDGTLTKVFSNQFCAKNLGFEKDVVAIGDSRSDIELFKKVALSIAINADFNVIKKADIALKTNDLLDILDLVL